MKRYLRWIFIFVFTTIPSWIVADSLVEYHSENPREFYNLLSPQTDGINRYGLFDVQLFTGRLNLSIPLYTITDIDFKLPISLVYASDGFRPYKHSGMVGLNWHLQVGGCITREIKGFADDKQDNWMIQKSTTSPPSIGMKREGMLIYARKHKHQPTTILHMDDSVFCDMYGSKNVGKEQDVDIDYQPDIYRFNFCGYNGIFTINNNGEPVIISGDFVKIDLAGLHDNAANIKCQYRNLICPQKDSKITIHTIDGYCYTFGGDITALEYTLSVPFNKTDCSEIAANKNQLTDYINQCQQYPSITSWYLTEIKSPNGRKMRFYYYDDDNVWAFNQYYNVETDNSSSFLGKSTYAARGMTKQSLLQRIEIPDTKFSLYCHTKLHNKKLYERVYSPYNMDWHLLKSITAQCDGRELLQADFTYEDKSAVVNPNIAYNYWTFLQAVQIKGQGKYIMKYDNNRTFPAMTCPGEYTAQSEVDSRGFSLKDCYLGLLNKITYPTGGYQVFKYEKHHYDIRQTYRYSQSFFVYTVSKEQKNTSGVRIASVLSYDKDQSLIETKTYNYQNSGVFYDSNIRIGSSNDIHLVKGIVYTDSYVQSHIGYGKVIEKTLVQASQSEHSIEYNFYTGKPIGEYNLLIQDINTSKGKNDYQYIAENGLIFYEPTLYQVGKLQSKKITTTASGTSSYQTTYYIHNHIPAPNVLHYPSTKSYTDYIDTIGIFSHWATAISRLIRFAPDFLLQKITVESTGNNEFSKHTHYEYDRLKRCTKIITRNSDAKQYFTSYRYPDEISAPNPQGVVANYMSLAKTYRIAEPIEILSGYVDKQNRSYITAGQLRIYKKNNMFEGLGEIPDSVSPSFPVDTVVILQSLYQTNIPPLPDFSYVSLSEDKTLQVGTPIIDYLPLSVNSDGSLVYDSRFKTSCTYKYNSLLRLTRIQPVGQMPTTYEWERVFPISQTTGIQTTTYTYLPYVGLYSTTDARGITTYYTYDNCGRLIEVYRMVNNQKEVLQSYYYHYATQE